MERVNVGCHKALNTDTAAEEEEPEGFMAGIPDFEESVLPDEKIRSGQLSLV